MSQSNTKTNKQTALVAGSNINFLSSFPHAGPSLRAIVSDKRARGTHGPSVRFVSRAASVLCCRKARAMPGLGDDIGHHHADHRRIISQVRQISRALENGCNKKLWRLGEISFSREWTSWAAPCKCVNRCSK